MDNMNGMTITAVNSVFYLTVPGLYPAPVKIEGYSTDAAISMAQRNPVIAQVGVDGHTSFGLVMTNKEITVTLSADSPSLRLFEDWAAAQDALREVLLCNAEFTLPAIGRKYVGSRGGMTAVQDMPVVAQTLQASAFVITFDKWESSPV